MLKEFRDFLLQGNVVSLAVAVVIGAAFGAVVNALVADIITPIIAAIAGQPDFGGLKFTINDSQFLYGDLINKILTLIIVGAAVFFIVVKPVNAMLAKMKKPEEAAGPTPEETRHAELIEAIKSLKA